MCVRTACTWRRPAPTARTSARIARTARTPARTEVPAGVQNAPEDATGSRLFVGLNVKLKGVEISDCDLLVVEGRVEATVHSKAMEIAKPGTLQGTVEVDVAEIHGDFTGELTARTRLVVHGTGRVAGTIRYGRLVVADGGTITGDVKELGTAEAPVTPARRAAAEPRTAS